METGFVAYFDRSSGKCKAVVHKMDRTHESNKNLIRKEITKEWHDKVAGAPYYKWRLVNDIVVAILADGEPLQSVQKFDWKTPASVAAGSAAIAGAVYYLVQVLG